MNREEKQLLLKDLCARQLYGVKAHYQYYDFVGGSERLIQKGDGVIRSIDISLGNPIYIDESHIEVENVKLYLRPMSSMTKEEDKEWQYYKNAIVESCDEKLGYKIGALHSWFNSHHFDFRGLIPMGLALDAPKGMYKTE